jgi:hypothetical protein
VGRPPFLTVTVIVITVGSVSRLAASPPDYAREVGPLLSDRCFKCHGPATQKARLRLDVAGEQDFAELLARITAEDDAGRMPPAESGPRLTPAQVDLLKRWVADGAKYAPHWAFVPPVRPVLPVVGNRAAVHNSIDLFVQAKLDAAKLTPLPEADRTTLIRRASLDLIGLLPTPEEVDAFVQDRSPDAYERVVDRLLASPHYGERQARHWLDLARYADSNGYTVDGPRTVWPYRDWVVRALNADVPFDRFTRDQLAGDLLPDATRDQRIATGFHRNTPFNEEGGADPEQFRVERTIDRTNTTGAVWLGLTVGCAQCHDHKYDPLPQADYFRLYAFFDSVDEPTMPVGGDPGLEKRVNELSAEIDRLKAAGKLDEATRVEKEVQGLTRKTPTTLVVRERKVPRQSYVHVRGDFLRKGDAVVPAFPGALAGQSPPTLAGQSPPAIVGGRSGRLSRLDLANWLCSPANPLTARVTVNREWQKFFGRGLVETENDFGMQGRPPTHPDLLDWLATEFRTDWSLKRLHRLIVTSAAYRRSSSAPAALRDRDPLNQLLARQNRLRLEAEVIRDAALSASGKLNPAVGGPPVYPPQPVEVFSFTQSKRTWPESKGPDRYRRGLYTYIWRQAQHPLLTTFDGPDAQTACTRRNRTTTPLQALHLANDPAFVELAAALGKRIEAEGPADDDGRVAYAFRLCFAREPSAAERDRLLAYLAAQRQADPATAWPRVGRVLLNLDEFITRE